MDHEMSQRENDSREGNMTKLHASEPIGMRVGGDPSAAFLTDEPRLIYVKDGWAWFTDARFEDVSIEGEFEYPYYSKSKPPAGFETLPDGESVEEDEEDVPRAVADDRVLGRLAFSTPLVEAYDALSKNGAGTFPLSANDIAVRMVAPWIANKRDQSKGDTPVEPISIFAGATIDEFVRAIDRSGGNVYGPINRAEESDRYQLDFSKIQ